MKPSRKRPATPPTLLVLGLFLFAISPGRASESGKQAPPTGLAAEVAASFRGEGRPVDQKKAFEIAEAGAQKGDPECALWVGYMYMNGQGVAQDNSQAEKWLRVAANGNVSRAQVNLALMLQDGRATSEDPTEARRWLEKAAEQNLVEAQLFLGESYYHSDEGTTPDHEKALLWFRRAAAAGNAQARNYVGVMLEYGQGTGVDGAGSVEMYRLAAEQNLAKAQANLGLAYVNGAGIAKDDVQALKWLQLSADQGEVTAIRALAELKEGLPGEVKKKAEILVAEYRQKQKTP